VGRLSRKNHHYGMIATILKENRMDPSFLIGTGDIVSLDLVAILERAGFYC